MNLLLICQLGELIIIGSSLQFSHEASFSLWLYIIPLVGIGVYMVFKSRLHQLILPPKDHVSDLQARSIEGIEFDRYAGGHPEITESASPCVLYVESGLFHICKFIDDKNVKFKSIGSIPLETILEFKVEDVFSMQRKTTSENWKKCYKYWEDMNQLKSTEIAFLVIYWNYDSIKQQTYFCLVGDAAMEMALKKRNALIKLFRQQEAKMA